MAAQAKTAALAVSSKVQSAAQSAANALSSNQTDLQDPEETQQCTNTQEIADSDSHDSPSSSPSSNAQGSAAEKARHALTQRIGMVTEGYSEDDCTCFDTTLGCTLKVRISFHAASCGDSRTKGTCKVTCFKIAIITVGFHMLLCSHVRKQKAQ